MAWTESRRVRSLEGERSGWGGRSPQVLENGAFGGLADWLGDSLKWWPGLRRAMSSRERIEVGGQARLGKFLFCFVFSWKR